MAIKWSHSRLNCILSNPMEYYLSYEQGISPIKKSDALAIGSAVHWGIEHNIDDLTEYTEDNFKQRDNYNEEQVLIESIIGAYLRKKDELFEKILSYDGEKLELQDETHEIKINANIKSNINNEPNNFLGIVDLLLLTNKGFIIIDYKTSSKEPDWQQYIEQLYRYIYLIKNEFPEIPILKIGIINLKKTQIRRKKDENDIQFRNRLKMEYDTNDELITYHEFLPEDIDTNLMNNYIENLEKTIDFAEMIIKNKNWYINYTAANGNPYKSQYWDIFYQTPGAENLYKISDKIWDEDDNEFKNSRNCINLDMQVINKNNILNHYSQYKNEKENCKSMNNLRFYNYLKNKYEIDDKLLKLYEKTYEKEEN